MDFRSLPNHVYAPPSGGPGIIDIFCLLKRPRRQKRLVAFGGRKEKRKHAALMEN